MVFLRPTIIRDDETMFSVSNEKYTKMREYQMQRHEDGINLMPDHTVPVLPEKSTADEILKQVQQRIADDKKIKQASLENPSVNTVRPARTYRSFSSKKAEGA